MRETRTVNCTDAAGQVRDRLQHHLARRGFRLRAGGPGTLIDAARGSWWGSLTSFSPKKWGARLKVFDPIHGTCRFDVDINTTGQRVTESETDFWEAEIDGIEHLMESGDAELADIDATSSKAARHAIKRMFGYAILFGGIGLVIDLVLLRFGAHTSLASIGAGMGAVAGATRGITSSRTRQ